MTVKSPIIGIAGSLLRREEEEFGSIWQVYVNQTYPDAVEQGGGTPLLLPCTGSLERLEAALSLCDGLLLPGGYDVDPNLYGEQPHLLLGAVLPELDLQWLHIVRWAMAHKIPVLGICRGMQLMNVAAGGSLYQDLGQRTEQTLQHLQQQTRVFGLHSVTLLQDSALARILGTQEVRANSLHHQAVKALGQGFCACAWTADGVIEGIESADGLCLGVQWHPEELLQTMPCMKNLFTDLCERAANKTI